METTYQNATARTVPERVSELLKISQPNAYCDDCIAGALNLRREQVSTVTSTLGLCREYARGIETCVHCNRTGKLATNYLG